MKIDYLGMGKRRYGQRFLPCYQRHRWEFQLILKGQCTLRRRVGEREEELRIDADDAAVGLLCGPESSHTWLGETKDECEVAVFHFTRIAPDLSQWIGRSGYRMIRLAPEDEQEARRWLLRCISGAASSPVVAKRVRQIVLAELELLFLPQCSEIGLPESELAKRRVAEAMEWYRANLGWTPEVGDVCKAMHLSPGHLRRIFHRVKGVSPQRAFQELRFERALQCMSDSKVTLEVVAEYVGFGSASAFSRAFKKHFSQSPSDYKKMIR